MIRCAGRTLDGQASVHSNAAWHRHAALSPSAHSEDGLDGSAPRGSSSMRWAYASAAGPTYESSVADTGRRRGTGRTRCSPRTARTRSMPSGVSAPEGTRWICRRMGARGTARRTTSCRRPGRPRRGSSPLARRSRARDRGRRAASRMRGPRDRSREHRRCRTTRAGRSVGWRATGRGGSGSSGARPAPCSPVPPQPRTLVPRRSAVTLESEDAEGSLLTGTRVRAAGTWLEHDHHAAK